MGCLRKEPCLRPIVAIQVEETRRWARIARPRRMRSGLQRVMSDSLTHSLLLTRRPPSNLAGRKNPMPRGEEDMGMMHATLFPASPAP